MKIRGHLAWFIFFLVTSLMAQDLKNLDYISPFHEGLAAVKKNDAWGFIDENGIKVIDFRQDIISREKEYPFFKNGRCLITEMKNGIHYYGYINPTGKTAIKPEFVNATSFEHGKAIALKVSKEVLGANNLLAKNVVSYNYDEVIINIDGRVVKYLGEPKHLILSSDKLRTPPAIHSYFINENLVAVKSASNKWEVKSIDY